MSARDLSFWSASTSRRSLASFGSRLEARIRGWRGPDRAGVGRREVEWQRHLADRGRRPAKCVRCRQACVGALCWLPRPIVAPASLAASPGCAGARAGARPRPRTPLSVRHVRLASAGPSRARTQGGRIVGAIWPTEDAALRSVSGAASGARGTLRGVLKLGFRDRRPARIGGHESQRRKEQR